MQHDFWKSATSYSLHLLFFLLDKYSLDILIKISHERLKILTVQIFLFKKRLFKVHKKYFKLNKFLSSF